MVGTVTADLTGSAAGLPPPSPLATRRSPATSPAGWWASLS